MPAAPSRRAPDWFLVGLAGAVALAFVAPGPGARGGWLHPEVINKLGVALIFFLHGAGLAFAALKAGTLNWPLHLVVQGATFAFFPAVGLVLRAGLAPLLPPALVLGLFFLTALPSTVSSSVALTAAARGNVPAAVFNATLSNLLGVFVTPLWLALVLGTTGAALPVGTVIVDLLRWLVLPLALGQLARPLIGAAIARHKPAVAIVDRATILLLVYTSFCDSVARGIWSRGDLGAVLATLALAAALLALVLASVAGFCRLIGLAAADRITAVFCGSQKTLAAGVPMAQLIFAGHPQLSLVLLPILIYHPLQLVASGWLAGRWARRPDAPPTT